MYPDVSKEHSALFHLSPLHLSYFHLLDVGCISLCEIHLWEMMEAKSKCDVISCQISVNECRVAYLSLRSIV